MKFLVALVVLSATVLSVVHGGIQERKNWKTSLKQMSWLEKMLIRKLHPKMNLDKMLALEAIKNGDIAIQDDYVGIVEAFQVEVPLLLLQLVKMGDDVLLPTFQDEDEWWFCFQNVCDGFHTLIDFRNARLINASATNLHASMNGTKFQVEFKVPDMEIQCPECTDSHTDYGQDPPATSDVVFYKGYSMFVKNFSMSMTGDFGWNFDRIDVTNFDLTLDMDEFWERQWNGTHTFPNGTQEELGPENFFYDEELLDAWSTGTETEFEELITAWLNCYLSNAKNNKEECGTYFNEPLHNVTASEILHAFGLAAWNNHRASQQPQQNFPTEMNLTADDPIETMNSIIFDFGTHVLQSSKYAAALSEDNEAGLQRTFTFVFNKEICSENVTGNAACETFQQQDTIGSPVYGTTMLTGHMYNRATLTFDTTTISYSFHVPDLTLLSTDYQRILTNLNTDSQQVFSGLNLNVFNCTLGFVADYGFQDGHYAVSNFKIDLLMDKVTMDIPEVSASENGEWIDLPSIHKDAAPMVMELWEGKDQDGVSLQERYGMFLQDKINDFLAGRIVI